MIFVHAPIHRFSSYLYVKKPMKSKALSAGGLQSKWIYVLLIVFATLVIAYTLFVSSNKVEKFTSLESSPELLNTCTKTKKPYTIMFFSMETCPHCKDFEPTWNKFDAYVQSNSVLSRKLCLSRVGSDDRETCGQFNVRGFPTVCLVDNATKKVTEFNQARTLEALKAFVLENTA